MRAHTYCRFGVSMMAVLLMPVLASAQGPRLQLDNLSRLASLASEVTDISLDPPMLQMAGNFLQNDPESAAVKQMISELKGVFIKSFEFDRNDAYSVADVQSVRKQLGAPWTRLVAAETKNPKNPAGLLELLEIYSYREGERSTGLAILVAEPRELTVVNIVGPIDLSKLAALEGKLGIPNIPTK